MGWEYAEVRTLESPVITRVPVRYTHEPTCAHETLEQRCEYIVCANCGKSLTDWDIESRLAGIRDGMGPQD